ncbi:MAG: tetratricopeptide repeat protein [Planctomycetota bacterium]
MRRRTIRPVCLASAVVLALALATAPTALLAGEGNRPRPVQVEVKAEGKEAEPEKPKPKPSLPAAREAITEGEYAQGLEMLDALLPEASPKAAAMIRALRARAYLETGKYQEAMAEAREAAKLAPKDPAPLCLLAEGLIITGEYDEAKQQLAGARQLDPEHLEARVLSLELAEITGDARAREEQVGYFFQLYNQGKASDAPGLTAVARAVQDEDPHGAWRAYQEAQQKDADYRPTYLEAGFLCLEKYAWQYARENFAKVLTANRHHAVAHAGLGAAYLANSKYDKALECIDAALKTNPKLPLALHLKASLYAAEQKPEKSFAAIQAALRVNPRNPRTLALAAAHFEAAVQPAARDEAIEQALAINPRYADVYTELALACQRLRRSPSAIAWARKAIKLRPRYWHGYYLAGMNLIRSGEEREGCQLLERAFQLNPFNIWAANTLTVLDRDFKKKEFVYHQTPHFFVKLDQREDKVLWPYLERLLEPMWDRLTTKYDFEPTGPESTEGKVLVLLYPKHSEFSARTTGLPGLSALGACLGQVITMPSPAFARQRPKGAFNWRQVLVHEFAHVVTLQKTDYHIPRWLTEGISVWEEHDTRVKWDQILAYGVDEKKLLPLEDFNRGFTRPKFPQQIALSYYQAFLITRHFDQAYGRDALLKMLDLFKQGKQTDEVLPVATGKPIDQLNDEALACVTDYAETIRRATRVNPKELEELEEKLKKNDQDPELWTEVAIGRLQARKPKEAKAAAEKAAELDPTLARAHGLLGFIAHAVDKDDDAAIRHYETAKQADPKYFPARLYLGLLTRGDDPEGAIGELEAARKLAPRYIEKGRNPYTLLADLYAREGETARAIAVLRELCQLDSNDDAARVRLAELLAEQGKHAEAADAYLDSIYINPFDLEVHLSAARACERADDPAQAAREYGVAAALEPKDMKALVGWAHTLAASGQPDACRQALAAIRALDPDNETATEIEKSLEK